MSVYNNMTIATILSPPKLTVPTPPYRVDLLNVTEKAVIKELETTSNLKAFAITSVNGVLTVVGPYDIKDYVKKGVVDTKGMKNGLFLKLNTDAAAFTGVSPFDVAFIKFIYKDNAGKIHNPK